MKKPVLADGDNALYHFFKNTFVSEETDESKYIIQQMLTDLSIWLPNNLYQKLPIILPFVIRDPSCRKAVNKHAEEWGSCNEEGYFRDDNTLIKSIPRSFKITSKDLFYSNKKMGNGFVACHIWRKLIGKRELASRNPLTNTFVPNLVWLPRQIAKLTDREGSFAQQYLQAMSVYLYKKEHAQRFGGELLKETWSLLAEPSIKMDNVDKDQLNIFDIGDIEIQNMIKNTLNRIELIKSPNPKRKLYCSRYFATYSKLPDTTKTKFVQGLETYKEIISNAPHGEIIR